MIDLYKRLRVPARTEDVSRVTSAIDRLPFESDLRLRSEHILLDPLRKRVYDEHHKAMDQIAEIRRLSGVAWTGEYGRDHADFDRNESGPLVEAPVGSAPRDTSEKQLAGWLIVVLVLGLVGLVVVAVVSSFDGSSAPTSQRQARSPQSQTPEPVRILPKSRLSDPLPMPPSGVMTGGSFNQNHPPFTVKTQVGGGHIYWKLVSLVSGEDVVTGFVRGGESMRTNVPPGRYELRYASGRDWYGVQALFGSSTQVQKATSTFHFYVTADQVSGYTVELYLQRDGNLRTRSMNRSQF